MKRKPRFWPVVLAIALVHGVAIIALLRWTRETQAANAQEITWLSEDAVLSVADKSETAPAAVQARAPETTAAPTSEIQLPTPTPRPTETPHPKPTPKISSTPKPQVKATPKKKTSPIAANEKSPAKKTAANPTAPKKQTPGKSTVEGSGDSAGKAGGQNKATESNWYGGMLHDRFYKAWEQPQTVVATGAKFSAVARIRIEKDGRVSNFKVVQPSGNVVVDQSIEAAGKRVINVDAPPAQLLSGNHYDVNVHFALNSQ